MRSSSPVVTPGRIASRVFSCISATTRPARRILASSSAFRLTTASGPAGRSRRSPGHPAVVDGADEAAEDLVGRTHPVDGDEEVAVEVPGDQGRRLLLVQVEAALDG